MAKIVNGKIVGTVDGMIYYEVNGVQRCRKKPEKVANPKTKPQQAHRNAFVEISRLSSAMKEGHAKGLHWQAVRQKRNTNDVFRKMNKNCYGSNGIDYAQVKISKGSVSKVDITRVNIDEHGNVHVEFHDDYPTEKNIHDEFFLFVFCPDQREGRFAKPVERTVGVIDAQIPESWRGHPLHLYAFMKDPKGKTSDTMYVSNYPAT